MMNPITQLIGYVRGEIDALRHKNGLALSYDNPFLFELKWTLHHFEDLYRITGNRGIVEALKYDALVTQARYELKKDTVPVQMTLLRGI